MIALDYCSRETVEISFGRGSRRVPAWRLGDWAAHKSISDNAVWALTHLPTGLGLYSVGVFNEADTAARAMAEISALRNTWDVDHVSELYPMRQAIIDIMGKHGATPARWKVLKAEDWQGRPRLNGYGPAVPA